MIEPVCGVCLDAHATLILVDELHNLDMGTPAGAEASDTLKYFSERLPATFVFSELKMIMNISCSEGFSGRVPDGCDQELDVAVVEAGEGVPEVDGYAVGQACRDLQHPLLASGAGKA